MQTNNEVSLKAASGASIAPFTLVAMTADGVAPCGAEDRAIGYVLPGDLNREYPTIHLFGFYAELIQSATESIAVGDEVECAADGKIAKLTTGEPLGVAVEAGSTADGRVDVVVYSGFVPTPAAT